RQTDASGIGWEYKYDERGNLESMGLADVKPEDVGFVPGEANWMYDELNNVTQSWDQAGLYTQYAYDLPECPTRVTRIGHVEWDAAGNEVVTRLGYYTDPDVGVHAL
ncbi:MAG: hypothetical protein AAB284_01590, partial [Chloroflexota bacterium]